MCVVFTDKDGQPVHSAAPRVEKMSLGEAKAFLEWFREQHPHCTVTAWQMNEMGTRSESHADLECRSNSWRRKGISTNPDASRLILTGKMFRSTLGFVEGGSHGHSDEEGRTQHEGQCV